MRRKTRILHSQVARLKRQLLCFLNLEELTPILGALRFPKLPLVAPLGLSFLGSALESCTFFLLVPFTKGMIEGNFRFLTSAQGWLSGYTEVIGHIPSDRDLFLSLVVIILTLILSSQVLHFWSRTLLARARLNLTSAARRSLFRNYLAFDRAFFDQSSAGQLQEVLLNSTEALRELLGSVGALIENSFSIAALLSLMLYNSPKLTLATMLILPLVGLSFNVVSNRLRAGSVTHWNSLNTQSKRASDMLSIIPLIKLYGQEKNEAIQFDRVSTAVASAHFSIEKRRLLMMPLQESISAVFLFSIATVMFLLVRREQAEISGFLVYFLMLRRLGNAFSSFNSTRVSLAGTSAIIAGIGRMMDTTGKVTIPSGRLEFHGLKAEIRFDRLNFSYPSGPVILHSVSFSIPARKRTAIVGETGSGKTTLINLLVRFYDCPPSSIFLDKQDIRKFSTRSVRDRIAVVSQDPWVFNATIRENLTYGLVRTIEEEELNEVAERSRLTPLLMKLPHGLDTEIGDRGVKLSGGEKQRLAIARAILKQAEILVLDEATSSLDVTTEKLVQEAIESAMENRTAVIIAHRLSTIRNADHIVTLLQGSVAEEGDLKSLLAKKGIFYRYWTESALPAFSSPTKDAA